MLVASRHPRIKAVIAAVPSSVVWQGINMRDFTSVKSTYSLAGKPVPYVAGRFQVVQSYDLRASDMFPSGAVAVAQAENLPQVLVEYVFPAAPENVASIREALTTGAEITLQRSHDLWALIHVGRHADGRMQFTVVPLPYGPSSSNWMGL